MRLKPSTKKGTQSKKSSIVTLRNENNLRTVLERQKMTTRTTKRKVSITAVSKQIALMTGLHPVILRKIFCSAAREGIIKISKWDDTLSGGYFDKAEDFLQQVQTKEFHDFLMQLPAGKSETRRQRILERRRRILSKWPFTTKEGVRKWAQKELDKIWERKV